MAYKKIGLSCFLIILAINFCAASSKANLYPHMRRLKLIPHVLPKPASQLRIARAFWDWGELIPGSSLKLDQVVKRPRVEWFANKGLFTLYMLGVSISTNRTYANNTYFSKSKINRQQPHWIVVNIPGFNVPLGDEIYKYVPPRLPDHPDVFHSYGIFVFKQQVKWSFTHQEIIKQRESANITPITEFVGIHSLGDAVYGTCFHLEVNVPYETTTIPTRTPDY